MSKNVAVFVDVANIFYAAKAAGVDIDYVTLLKSASAGRDLVRAYAYTGLDPDNENQRNFHSFLARHGYRVVSKDIRKYGDGKVKANLDIELVVDMMKTARNLDIAIVVSGDGDFAPAIRAVQEMGVRVEVISFRGNTSSDLMDVADQFTDITALAKVEKGSSRSGRRVAEADEDLSMTEVPDKQTEGAGGTRGRGGRSRGGRGRGREEAEPAARTRRPIGEPAALTSSGAPLVVLPGEKLSRVADGAAATPAGELGPRSDADADLEDPETGGAVAMFGGAIAGVTAGPVAGATSQADDDEEGDGEVAADGDESEEGRRRRRRRGGRGRGRGRGRGENGESLDRPVALAAGADDDEFEEPVEAPRPPRTNAFGSVWDSQLGMPTVPTGSGVGPIGDDDDLEEPEIPEYLLAERRNRGRQGGPGQRGGRGGPRGGRSAYAAAMDRERYGGGRGSGGLNRYPDVSARERPPEPRREERGPRPVGGGGAPGGRRGGGGDEPWSEVPPELEAMLRAQLGNRPADRRPDAEVGRRDRAEAPSPPATVTVGTPDAGGAVVPDAAADADTDVIRDAGAADVAAPVPAEGAAGDESPTAAPRRRATRRPRAATPVATPDSGGAAPDPVAAEDAGGDAGAAGAGEAPPAPKRRTTRRKPATADADSGTPGTTTGESNPADGAETAPATDKPKRRTTRRKASADEAGAEPAADSEASAEPPAPRRRATRRKAGEDAPGG